MTKTNKKQRKQYPQAFKDSAVRLAEESGRGATAVAHDLGIPVEYLYRGRAARRGVSAGEQAFPGHGRARDEEVSALKRENARLRQQQEILKKALGVGGPLPRSRQHPNEVRFHRRVCEGVRCHRDEGDAGCIAQWLLCIVTVSAPAGAIALTGWKWFIWRWHDAPWLLRVDIWLERIGRVILLLLAAFGLWTVASGIMTDKPVLLGLMAIFFYLLLLYPLFLALRMGLKPKASAASRVTTQLESSAQEGHEIQNYDGMLGTVGGEIGESVRSG